MVHLISHGVLPKMDKPSHGTTVLGLILLRSEWASYRLPSPLSRDPSGGPYLFLLVFVVCERVIGPYLPKGG